MKAKLRLPGGQRLTVDTVRRYSAVALPDPKRGHFKARRLVHSDSLDYAISEAGKRAGAAPWIVFDTTTGEPIGRVSR